MATERAYTWAIVTYATKEEFEPLLRKSNHWAYATHDKDKIVNDLGQLVPKEKHTHIIATFEDQQSFKQVREMVQSSQNTLAQPCRNRRRQGRPMGGWGGEEDSIVGLWKYLIHEGQDPTIKHIYEEKERICDDLEYWKRRTKDESKEWADNDTFYEDLTSENFSISYMGRKYGRDFMRNMNEYLKYRSAVLREKEYNAAIKEIMKKNNQDKETAENNLEEIMKIYNKDKIPRKWKKEED